MQTIGFGRFEKLRIESGEPVVAPWPTTLREIRFGNDLPLPGFASEFTLKTQVVELLRYTRSIATGEIRVLEFRHGLPFSMEIEVMGEP
jgi:hypothetical protein